jgi:hypothetical protein
VALDSLKSSNLIGRYALAPDGANLSERALLAVPDPHESSKRGAHENDLTYFVKPS